MYLYERYHPITAHPFRRSDEHIEIAPCDELKPYIRCFWGTRTLIPKKSVANTSAEMIIPDTCVDLIFTINYTKNTISSSFCGIDDVVFKANSSNHATDEMATFAIRFYAWSAVLFAEESMKGTKNQFLDAGVHFEKIKREMEGWLFETGTIEERISLAEKCLLKHLNTYRVNSLLMRAIGSIVEQKGNLRTLELAKDLHISSKQMERVFHENMGITPKKAASLIRYQYLWQEVCFNPAFRVLDAVYKYGYVDQAHLLNDFRKIHGLSLGDARQDVWNNR